MPPPVHFMTEVLRALRTAVPRLTQLQLATENVLLPAAHATKAGSRSIRAVRQVSIHDSLPDPSIHPKWAITTTTIPVSAIDKPRIALDRERRILRDPPHTTTRSAGRVSWLPFSENFVQVNKVQGMSREARPRTKVIRGFSSSIPYHHGANNMQRVANIEDVWIRA